MKRIAIFLLVLLPSSGLACVVDPEQEARSLSAETGKAAVRRLWDSDACEFALLDGVASGKPQWINFAIAIRPYTDAASGETLMAALSFAMLAAPSRLLPLVDMPSFGANLCIPIDYDDSPEGAVAFKRRVAPLQLMCERFLRTSLRRQALTCIAEVRSLEGPRQ